MSKECHNCHEDNLDSAEVCENCRAPLLNSENVDINSNPCAVLILKHIKTGKEINIHENCILGRDGDIEPDFFTDENRFVSGLHCKITVTNGEFKIEHIGKNPTKINNKSLSKGISILIRDGDLLTIADRTFNVSISDTIINNEITNQDTQESCNSAEIKKTKYIITCPECGKEYEVSNIEDRIKECDSCDDYTKDEIFKIRAKFKNAD